MSMTAIPPDTLCNASPRTSDPQLVMWPLLLAPVGEANGVLHWTFFSAFLPAITLSSTATTSKIVE